MSLNRRAALVIAHPGHELRVLNWLNLARPTVFVLTDGSGRSQESRLHQTTKILNSLGVRQGSIYGRLTDIEIQLLSIYRDVIDEHNRIHSHDVVAEQNALGDYLDKLKPRLQAVEMLEGREIELEMIRSSRSWIVLSRYAGMKGKVQSFVASGLARLTRKPENQGPTN